MGSRRSLWSLALISSILVPFLLALVSNPSPASEAPKKPLGDVLFKECKRLHDLVLPASTRSLQWIDGQRLGNLSVSGSEITSLQGLPASLRELDVSNNKQIKTLQFIPKGLRVLDIRGTSIKDLRELPPYLEVLKLSGTYIRNLKSLRPTLRELHLEDFDISDFSELPRDLREVHLSGARFRTLQGLPPALRRLTLQNTGIESLKGLREALPVLTQLTLIENNSMRFEVGDLPDGLTELKVDQKQGREPADLSRLEYLSWLSDRRDIPVEKVPTFLCSLTLGASLLQKLPSLPSSLRSLGLIRAGFDPTSDLPPGLESLSLLGYRGPELKRLPSSLKRLTVKDSSIATLPKTQLNLEELQIGQTNIEDLHGFQGKLKKLVFCETKLQKMNDIKTDFPHLQDLDLCDSEFLQQVGPLPSSLRKLSLSGTKISQLPDFTHELQGLRELNISKTPVRLASLSSLPRQLETLILSDGQVASWEGIPPTLKVLRFE